MKLYQLCIANVSLISDQKWDDTVDDYLDPNIPFQTLDAAKEEATKYIEEAFADDTVKITLKWTESKSGKLSGWRAEHNGGDEVVFQIWVIEPVE